MGTMSSDTTRGQKTKIQQLLCFLKWQKFFPFFIPTVLCIVFFLNDSNLQQELLAFNIEQWTPLEQRKHNTD